MSRPIVKGSLVDVTPQQKTGRRNSEGGRGLVIKKKRRRLDGDGNEVVLTQQTNNTAASGESLYNVRYLVGGGLSQNIMRERIDVAMIGTTARFREGQATTRPSILSTEHLPAVATAPAAPLRNPGPHRHSMPWLLKLAGKRSKQRNGSITFVLLEELKRKNKNETNGWLRRMETGNSGHLSTDEKRRMFDLYLPIKSAEGSSEAVRHAWGVSRSSFHELYKSFIKNGNTRRKRRSDAGVTLINSDQKRASVYTPSFIFAKLLRHKNDGAAFTKAQLEEEWKKADASTVTKCNQIAKEWLNQGPFLISEITKALGKTKGSVSWTTLATLIAGTGNLQPISDDTIRRYVMSLPDSSYKTTRILPKLDKANKQQRLWWSHQFWIFWNSAVSFNTKQIILVHMDEKWFWAIVVRRNLKSGESIHLHVCS